MVQVIVLSGIGLFLGIGCVVPYAMLGQWRKLLLNQVVLIALVFLLLPPCCCICIPVPIAIVGTLALNGLALVDGLLIVKARESGTAYPVYGYAVRPLWHIMRFIDRRAVHVPVSLPR